VSQRYADQRGVIEHFGPRGLQVDHVQGGPKLPHDQATEKPEKANQGSDKRSCDPVASSIALSISTFTSSGRRTTGRYGWQMRRWSGWAAAEIIAGRWLQSRGGAL